MQVKSFTYERSWYGAYHRQRIFSVERMDAHIAKLLAGWLGDLDPDQPLWPRQGTSAVCQT